MVNQLCKITSTHVFFNLHDSEVKRLISNNDGNNRKTTATHRVHTNNNHHNNHIHRYLPYIGSGLCVLAFTICFIITKAMGHLPSWFVFPPISFLGYQMPEHVAYAVLFSAGGICYLISFLYISTYSFKKHGMYDFAFAFAFAILINDS